MATVLALALPGSLIFMGLSGRLDWQGFVLGYIVAAIILRISGANQLTFMPGKVVSQVFNFIIYGARLLWDIFLSSWGVARIVLTPGIDHQIDPAIIRISTQDDGNDPVVSAISAHGISITPGQLVVDITTEEDGQTYLHVHNLHATDASPTIAQEQTARLQRIRKITGND